MHYGDPGAQRWPGSADTVIVANRHGGQGISPAGHVNAWFLT
jgi:hypothetical protein